MNGKAVFGLGLLLLSLLTFSVPSKNLFADPSMENLGNWKLVTEDYLYRTDLFPGAWWENSDYVFQTNYTAHSGSWSRQIYKWYYYGPDFGFTQIVNYTNYTGKYNRMNVSIYTKNDSGFTTAGNFTVIVRFLNSSRAQISNYSVTFMPTSAWVNRGIFGMVIPSSARYVQTIVVAANNTARSAYFDDANMTAYNFTLS